MIDVATGEMLGRTEFHLKDYTRAFESLWLMMASDFSMRAKWRALKSGWRSAPQKVLDRGNIVRDGRKRP